MTQEACSACGFASSGDCLPSAAALGEPEGPPLPALRGRGDCGCGADDPWAGGAESSHAFPRSWDHGSAWTCDRIRWSSAEPRRRPSSPQPERSQRGAPRSAAVPDSGKVGSMTSVPPRARCRLLYGPLLPGRVGHRQQLLGFADVAGGADGAVEGECLVSLRGCILVPTFAEELLDRLHAYLGLELRILSLGHEIGEPFEVAGNDEPADLCFGEFRQEMFEIRFQVVVGQPQ